MNGAAHIGETARYIETLGLPGAGKTTFVSRLNKTIVPQWTTRLFSPPVAPTVLSAAAATASLTSRAMLGNPGVVLPLLTDRGGRWLVSKLGYRIASLTRRRPSPGEILVDGGVVQPFVSFLAEYRQSRALRAPVDALWPKLPLPAALLYFDVPAEDAHARYVGRDPIAAGHRPGANVSSATFTEAAELCGSIVRRFRNEGKPVLELTNADMTGDADLTAVIRKIADFSALVSSSDAR